MANIGEMLSCELCGNVIVVVKAGGNPEIHCCKQAMKKMEIKD